MNFKEFFVDFPIRTFSLIILGSLGRRGLLEFCSKNGIAFPGFRLEKVPDSEIIEALYFECGQDRHLLQNLQDELDRCNRTVMETLKNVKVKNFQRELDRIDEMENSEELLAFIWAGLRDKRRTINRVAVETVGMIEDVFDQGGILPEEVFEPSGEEAGRGSGKREEQLKAEKAVRPSREDGKSDSGKPPREDRSSKIRKPKEGSLAVLSGFRKIGEDWRREVKNLEKYLKKLEAEAEKARRRAEKRKKEVSQLNEQIRELRSELKESRRQIRALKKEKTAPEENLRRISELKSRLHTLQRENRKKSHEIRERREDRGKLDRLREELGTARQALKTARTRIEEKDGIITGMEGGMEKLQDEIETLKKEKKTSPERRPPPGDRERVGIYFDSRNIYYSARNAFAGARVDIKELITRIARGRKVVRALAYVVQADFDNKRAYFDMLGHQGFRVKRRNLKVRMDGSMKGNWDMGMALDLMRNHDDVDTIALVSGDGDFRELVTYLKSKGLKIEVYGVEGSTAFDLKQAADLFVPIEEKWLLRE